MLVVVLRENLFIDFSFVRPQLLKGQRETNFHHHIAKGNQTSTNQISISFAAHQFITSKTFHISIFDLNCEKCGILCVFTHKCIYYNYLSTNVRNTYNIQVGS